METGVRIMWPPVRAEVVRTGNDTLPLYTQPQSGCQPMRQVVAASGEQRVGAVNRIRTGTIKSVMCALVKCAVMSEMCHQRCPALNGRRSAN